MNFVSLIQTKRDGGRLTDDEIQWLIAEYSADRIPEYQMSSMLMAVFLVGLDPNELAAWTDAMLHSGDILDFSHVAAPKIDKHSTGGVGDKVSIPLVPIVATCGVAVPMISGRGLGHTGGTLDKLETIPGFRTALDPPEFSRILERHGMVMAGQSETLVPADRRIYALRDVSGTVPSIPLISSSIMSKKLAEGLDGLVLDVKVGSGAFMKDLDQARQLATTMVGIGRTRGTTVTALITNMSQPLGREVGNASEIRESIEVLHGGGGGGRIRPSV
jgi:pyrimidine-nucleoside phosphorylase